MKFLFNPKSVLLLLISTGVYANDCSKIYVGNLSFNTSEIEIFDLFDQYGQVTEVNMITDKDTGRFRGFAFVKFADCNTATAAVEGLDGRDFWGRSLRVSIALPRDQRPSNKGGKPHRNYNNTGERW